MFYELVYTSLPKGLAPGSQGFCTVAATTGLPRALGDRLEALSGYRHVFAPDHAQAAQNPPVLSHVRFAVGSASYHALSRVVDYGFDYTQRSNKLAHHLALPAAAELSAIDPAWLMAQPGVFITHWQGEARWLPDSRALPSGENEPRPCQAWERAAGHAGWAGVLAAALNEGSTAPLNVIYGPGLDVLPLVCEVFALLPLASRSRLTFSTYFTKLPPDIDCRLRFVLQGTPEAALALRAATTGSFLIDLCGPRGSLPDSPFVTAACTGDVTSLRAAAAERTAGRGASVSRRAATPVGRAGLATTSKPLDPALADPLGSVLSAAPAARGKSGSGKLALISLALVAAIAIVLGVATGGDFAQLLGQPSDDLPHVEASVPRVIETSQPAANLVDPERIKKLSGLCASLKGEVEEHAGETSKLLTKLEALKTQAAKSKTEAEKRGNQFESADLSKQQEILDKLTNDIEGLRSAATYPDEIKKKQDAAKKLREQAVLYRNTLGEIPPVPEEQGERDRLNRQIDRATASLSKTNTDLTDATTAYGVIDGQLIWFRAQREAFDKKIGLLNDKANKESIQWDRAFEALAIPVDLPERTGSSSTATNEPLVVFSDPLLALGEPVLTVRNNPLGGGRLFDVAPPSKDEPRNDGQRTWLIRRRLLDAEFGTNIAELNLQNDGLRFRWLRDAGSDDECLRNCAFELSLNDKQGKLFLRKPKEINWLFERPDPRLSVPFESRTTAESRHEDSYELRSKLAALPRFGRLILRIDDTRIARKPGAVTPPLGTGGPMVFALPGQNRSADLKSLRKSPTWVLENRGAPGGDFKIEGSFYVLEDETALGEIVVEFSLFRPWESDNKKWRRYGLATDREEIGRLEAQRNDLNDRIKLLDVLLAKSASDIAKYKEDRANATGKSAETRRKSLEEKLATTENLSNKQSSDKATKKSDLQGCEAKLQDIKDRLAGIEATVSALQGTLTWNNPADKSTVLLANFTTSPPPTPSSPEKERKKP